MTDQASRTVRLAGADDVAGLRAAVRSLLAQGVEPARVQWQLANAAEADLFADLPNDTHGADRSVQAVDAAPLPSIRLPALFVSIFERAALHTSPSRHGLLYRLAWRLAHDSRLRHDALDADRLHVEQLAREVRRDMHKMTAFVRFRPVVVPGSVAESASELTHIAWFEPAHHVVRATAPFFVRRFAQMRWAILTPERCARWDGEQLSFGPGARRDEAPAADASERLWFTYYKHIFNPARLKLAMMQKEMPRRYWKNLPEAVLIQPLAAQAAERSQRMIDQGGTEPAHRRPAACVALGVERRERTALAAITPGTLEALHAGTERCRACAIGQDATQAVNGEGPIGAQLMLVGEQPGDQEELRGRPFVGPAGQLLDRALAQLGWPRETLYITNAVKHFKFELRGKRRLHKTPAQQEAAACLDWLEAEIDLVKPHAIVALGATAARSLLGRAVGIHAERGRWALRGDGLRVLVTLHPSALLRTEPRAFNAAYAAWLDDLRRADVNAVALAPG